MGIFSSHKNKDELILVFNVGSSFVGGALFWTQKSGIPKIIFSTREPIPVEEKMDIDRFLFLTLQSLEIIVKRVADAKLGAPSKIFCILPPPWLVSQTRIINFKKNTPFIFTTKLAEELIQKEIKLFEEENLIKYKNVSSSIRSIEFKNIKTSLNGYETSEPLNKKVTELEMVIFVSISGEQILKKIEDTVAKVFHFDKITFSSFTMATFTVVRDLFPKKDNFLLFYIGGEVTDISMVKKGTLRESISFPIGCNFITRGVASGLNCSLNEASSFLSLFKDGHAEEKLTERLIPIIKNLKTEWLKSFQESLAHLSSDISIPATIYMYMGKDMADLFSDTIKTEQFSQYTLTESKFEIVFLNAELLHGKAIFEESVIREPFLLVDSIYINRFLIYPAFTG